MQAIIADIHAQENIDDDWEKRCLPKFAGKMLFRTIGLDPEILSLDEAPDDEVLRRNTCVSNAWIEDWKDGAVNSRGFPVLEQRVFTKYGSLEWVNPDHGHVFTVHPYTRQGIISEEEGC